MHQSARRNTFGWIIIFLWLVYLPARAQHSLSGRVIDASTHQPLPYANVVIKGTMTGVSTDASGNFQLKTRQAFPFTLVVSAVGYASVEQIITDSGPVECSLAPQPILAGEVVITASRVAESLLQSPITVEQLDLPAIRQTPAPTFFDALEGVKGVQMTTVSLGFKVPNTRGFTNPTNVRFLQLVDGVDTQAPVIGASVANAAGPTELDIERVELIPGTASALYGMNSLNGLVNFMTRNPFDYQGLSAYQRTGVNHLNSPHTAPRLLSESAFRYAKAYHNRLAFKVNFAYLTGYDWIAHQTMDLNPEANVSVNLTGAGNPALDPVSSYGNEGPNRRTLAIGGKNYVVARTGYYEKDITDYRLQNLKADVSMHYRLRPDVEASYGYRMGRMDNVYQRTNRFRLNDYFIGQHQFQLKSPAFQFRTYLTRELSGNSYNIRSLAENLDRQFKPDDQWFSEYRASVERSLQAGTGVEESHRLARALADAGRFVPGTARYDSAVNQLIAINNWDVGAALRTEASLFHAETQYDLSRQVRFFRLLVGADYRRYSVFPDGNYFINPVEAGRNLSYNKGGAFIQVSRKLLRDQLQLNAVLRYDRNEYFRGIVNPRVGAVYTFKRNHYFRASYQNGYRFPSLFEAFSNVNSGGVKRVGGLPLMSRGIFEDSYIRTSIDAFTSAVNRQVNQQNVPLAEAISANAGLLKKSTYEYIQPERINSFELGYKSLTLNNRLYIDADFYFNFYKNFIAQVEVNQTIRREIPADSVPFHLYDRRQQARYRLWTNSTSTVYNYGSSLGVRYNFAGGFTGSGNLSYARLHRKAFNDGLEEAFNTPRWISNLSFGNPEVIKNLGFQVVWHWQDRFLWQSALGSGTVPAYYTLDAQVSLKIPPARMLVKAGGSNLLNRPYYQMIAGPTVGAMYYVTLVFDELLR
jgi:iron complex outermembrane recepter protein